MGEDAVAVVADHPQRRERVDRGRLEAGIADDPLRHAIDQRRAGKQQRIAQDGEAQPPRPHDDLQAIEQPVEERRVARNVAQLQRLDEIALDGVVDIDGRFEEGADDGVQHAPDADDDENALRPRPERQLSRAARRAVIQSPRAGVTRLIFHHETDALQETAASFL